MAFHGSPQAALKTWPLSCINSFLWSGKLKLKELRNLSSIYMFIFILPHLLICLRIHLSTHLSFIYYLSFIYRWSFYHLFIILLYVYHLSIIYVSSISTHISIYPFISLYLCIFSTNLSFPPSIIYVFLCIHHHPSVVTQLIVCLVYTKL